MGIPDGYEGQLYYCNAGSPVASVKEVLEAPAVIQHDNSVDLIQHYMIKLRLILLQVGHKLQFSRAYPVLSYLRSVMAIYS